MKAFATSERTVAGPFPAAIVLAFFDGFGAFDEVGAGNSVHVGISQGSTMIGLDGGELYEPLTIPHNGYVFDSKTKTGSNSGPEGQGLGSSIRATRKERRCFAAECGLWPASGRKDPGALLGPHEKNGAVLLQNAAPTPLGTHEHSRVRFRIRGPRDRV